MTARALSRRGALGAASCLVSLGGCSLLFPAPAPQLYRLTLKTGGAPIGPRVSGQLVVSMPMASESLNTERIALVRDQTTFDYFAGAAWTDRAPRLLQRLMIDAFEDSDRITAVGDDSSDFSADYRLETVVRDFQVRYSGDAAASPIVVVKIDAQLLRTTDHRVLGHVQMAKAIPADRNSLENIVVAFDTSVGAVIDDVVGWTLRTMR